MSLVVMAVCDGYWDSGRMPCRGAISAHRTVPLEDELRANAAKGGWELTEDGDFCPAHARIRREEAEAAAARAKIGALLRRTRGSVIHR